jgi:hypothetical protein
MQTCQRYCGTKKKEGLVPASYSCHDTATAEERTSQALLRLAEFSRAFDFSLEVIQRKVLNTITHALQGRFSQLFVPIPDSIKTFNFGGTLSTISMEQMGA